MTTSLIKYDTACLAIAEASSVDEVKSIRDKAEAVRAYGRQAQNLELEQQAMMIQLRAERRAGELLKEMKEDGQREKQGGDRKSKSQTRTLKLSDLGISKKQSADWQKMAEIPAPDFEARVAAVTESHEKVTTHSILHPDPPPPPPTPPDSTGPSMWDLLSAVHKAIRRNDQHEALRAAWQLDKHYNAKYDFGGQLWSELRRITCEDIGPADPQAACDIYVLWRFWEKATESDSKNEPWRLYTARAVLRLCEAPKSRAVDHGCILMSGAVDKLIAELRGETWPQPVPAYAHDGLHTGKKNGKTTVGFIIEEKAALSPAAFGIEGPFEVEAFKKVAEFKAISQGETTAAKPCVEAA